MQPSPDMLQPDIYGTLIARLHEAAAAVRRLAAARVPLDSAEPTQVLAAIIGCGDGGWLQPLAAQADRVLAVDPELAALRSTAQLAAAARLSDGHVKLLLRDPGSEWPLVAARRCGTAQLHPQIPATTGWGGCDRPESAGRWPFCHLVVCANESLSSPDPLHRRRVLANAARCLRPGGAALLLVRAAESRELVCHRQERWLELGLPATAVSCSGRNEPCTCCAMRWSAGGVCCPQMFQGQQQQGQQRSQSCSLHHHYRRDELLSSVVAAGLQVEGLERVEHEWTTVFPSLAQSTVMASDGEHKRPDEPHASLTAEEMMAKLGRGAGGDGQQNPFAWLVLATCEGGPNPFAKCAAAQWETFEQCSSSNC